MKLLLILSLSLISLTACNSNSSSDGGGTTDEPTTPNPPTPTPKNQLGVLSNQGADTEPSVLKDALQNDIDALFKDADAEPVNIEDGDSIQDVISRIDVNI